MKRERLLQVGTILFSTTLVVIFLSCQMKKSQPTTTGKRTPGTSTSQPATQRIFMPGSKSAPAFHDEDGKNILYGDDKTVLPGSKSSAPFRQYPLLPGSESKVTVQQPATATQP